MLGTQATAADATGKALVFITGSVDSGSVAAKFADVAVPVIVNEASNFDDMRMTGTVQDTDFGIVAMQVQLAIVMQGHALAGGLSGTPTVYPTPRSVRWGLPGASAI